MRFGRYLPIAAAMVGGALTLVQVLRTTRHTMVGRPIGERIRSSTILARSCRRTVFSPHRGRDVSFNEFEPFGVGKVKTAHRGFEGPIAGCVMCYGIGHIRVNRSRVGPEI